MESSVKAIQTLARKLKPELDVSQVCDEWRVNSCDPNVAQIEMEQSSVLNPEMEALNTLYSLKL